MLILLVYAALAGAATVLSPCILPVLPIVFFSSLGADRLRPLGVVAGLIASFAVATLAVAALVAQLHLPADALRDAGIVIIALAGISLLAPEALQRLELALGRVAQLGARMQQPRRGFAGGFLLGIGLGLVWTPCAGPILATVVTLAAINQVSAGAIAVVVAYAAGAGIPMLGIAYGGRWLVSRARRISRYAGLVQRGFGVLMVLVALALATGADRRFQVWASNTFPGGWNTPFTSVEASAPVQQALHTLRGVPTPTPAVSTSPTPASVSSLSAQDAGLGLQNLGVAPNFSGITRWYNTSQALTITGLRGKVVLVDFWTYSCINCLRTLPHVKDWYARYRGDGLVVVGVHSPEFAFEGIPSNVAAAIRQWGITYPVALDPTYKTWDAYNNEYWPAEYLIDAQGTIRYTSFGEGDYDQTERVIRQLLADAHRPVHVAPGDVPDTTPIYTMTPETYVGAERMSNFDSPEPVTPGKAQDFTLPATLPGDHFAFAGRWRVDAQSATALRAGDSLEFTFTAANVYVIFAPRSAGDRVHVLLDGKPVGAGRNAGSDVQGGVVRVTMDNLYNVVDVPGYVDAHQLRLVFETAGTQVYSFTFG
jgi:cytochrome c biogenesis protein CcdA/thiol-disulfide isomerase/thioredoxin